MRGKYRLLAAAGMSALTIIGASSPAFAGGTGTRSDPAGDTVDPYVAESSLQKGTPGYYNSNSPITDIRSWSLTGTTVNGVPALQARITVNGTLPTPGSIDPPSPNPYPGFGGLTLMATFSVPRTENNSIRSLCPGVGGADLYHYFGHYLDGYKFTVEAGFDYSGIWSLTPIFGYYNPNPVQDPIQFRLFDLDSNQLAAGLAEAHVEGGNTAVVTVPTRFRVPSSSATSCANGATSWDFSNSGDLIVNASAISFEDQVVVLPIAVPESITCGPTSGAVCSSDLKAVGGLIYPSDWSTAPDGSESYDIGIAALGSNGYTSISGPTCPTPPGEAQAGATMRLPNLNPLYQAGQPCEIQNPVGQHFIQTGINFTQ